MAISTVTPVRTLNHKHSASASDGSSLDATTLIESTQLLPFVFIPSGAST